MKVKTFRLTLLLSALAAASSAVALALYILGDQLVYYYVPSDIDPHQLPARTLRLGGLVEEGSLTQHHDSEALAFYITDLKTRLPVVFRGIPPALFQEGRGVVAEGRFRTDGTFQASLILAKHDETYMPPYVAKSLQAQHDTPTDTPYDN
ncbi:MAG: cytochrome c maturation protein CcmE [Alphaproteobacteria bacterium GM202ARS2]|nr:cytochrome c maturation protein CcmE [Alphaproteobacteria bacterium GM202ARS2]